MEDYIIPNHHEIFNDYDYCDYKFIPEYRYSNKDGLKPDNIEHLNKWRRK